MTPIFIPKFTKGFLILILLGFIWGTGYSIARFAMTNGVPPLGYSFWQSLGPFLVIVLIVFMQKQKLKINMTYSRYYFICAITGIVIPNTAMYFAAPHLPAGILAMIVNTVPFFAYLMALFAKLEKLNWQRGLGILLALSGLLFLILPKTSLPNEAMIPWVLTTLITPASFAFCSVYIARFRPKDSSTLTLTAGMLLFSSLILMPIVILSHQFYYFHYPFNNTDWIILLEIMLSSMGYLLFFQLIKMTGPVYYSLVDTIVVLTGVFWGYIIFGEHLNQWTMSAIVCILIALLLVTQQQKTAAVIKNDDI